MSRIYSTNANYRSSGHGDFSLQNYSSMRCKMCGYKLLLSLAHTPSLFNPFKSVFNCPSWEIAILSFTGGHLSRNSIEKINLLSAFCSLGALNTELNRVRSLVLKKTKTKMTSQWGIWKHANIYNSNPCVVLWCHYKILRCARGKTNNFKKNLEEFT